jgi:hypothetical protein
MQELKISMKAEIYRMVFDSSIEQFVPEKYSLPVTVYGVGRDSLLYDAKSTSTLNLPLQKLDSISSFAFITTINRDSNLIEIVDTIDIYHTNTEEFISLECGCVVSNTIVGIAQTTNRIDSIVVMSPDVNLQSTNNIKIYLSQR